MWGDPEVRSRKCVSAVLRNARRIVHTHASRLYMCASRSSGNRISPVYSLEYTPFSSLITLFIWIQRALKLESPLPPDANSSSSGGNNNSAVNTPTGMDLEDPLMMYLYQISGPLHIPHTDPIWLELLHGYNVWVHVTIQQHPPARRNSNNSNNTMMEVACQRMRQYSIHTSNMAAFTIHLIRLLQEYMTQQSQNHAVIHDQHHHTPVHHHQSPLAVTDQDNDTIRAFSNRIAIVEKARALAGALNLYRLLIHTILSSSSTWDHHDDHPEDDHYDSTHDHDATTMEQIFTYSCRETNTSRTTLAVDLLNTVLQFLRQSQGDHQDRDRVHHRNTNTGSCIPAEVYDCYTLALQLVLVLLSTQLYQPLCSSFQQQQQPRSKSRTTSWSFWNILLQEANRNESHHHPQQEQQQQHPWSVRQLLQVLCHWSMVQPIAPSTSIQYYHCQMAQQLIATSSQHLPDDGNNHGPQHHHKHKLGPDLMYEDYYIVHAVAPHSHRRKGGDNDDEDSVAGKRPDTLTTRSRSGRSLALLDATKGVLVFSSKLILLLPYRLMSLALSLWGLQQHPDRTLFLTGHQSYSSEQLRQMQQRNRQHSKNKRRTRDVLWLSMSPLGDLSTSLLLLLTNNQRHANCQNLFRAEMIALSDNRWGDDDHHHHERHHYDLPDLPDASTNASLLTNHSENGHATGDASVRSLDGIPTPEPKSRHANGTSDTLTNGTTTLMINFEGLFASFGRTAHTEPGALWLYTLLQLSPSFASAIAVRSDLDTIVLPLLRTLYYSTSTQYHVAQDYQSKVNQEKNAADSPRQVATKTQDHPYRSQSQLYVIIILLLLLSQDSSFGSDAFRRVAVPIVPWYKERYLKDIRLGSILILVLLRSLTFNLTRQHDAFLLTNCCAVLMNLSSSIVDLHDYTAMKFVTTTIAFMKRYLVLRQQNPNNNDDDITTPTSMYGEASRTLLCVLKHCLGIKSVEKNLHLVYALVYHQADLARIFGNKGWLLRVFLRVFLRLSNPSTIVNSTVLIFAPAMLSNLVFVVQIAHFQRVK